jgi:PAS domain S-box-containing protein
VAGNRTDPRRAEESAPPFPAQSSSFDSLVAAAHLAAIVESSDDAIVSKTLDGVVTSWNRGAERLFGYSSSEMLGESITRIIPPERLGEEAQILSQISRGEQVQHFDTVRRRKDGSLVDISLTVSPIRDSGGRIIGASKVARDITDRRKAEECVRELNETLEARVRERTAELESFSYTIAHDLRAPLRAVHRYSDLLREDYGGLLDEQGLDFLRRMAEGAERMDRMIEDLLSYSRVSRADIKLAPVSVGAILTEIRFEMGRELEARHCDLAGEGELPEVLGDRLLLKQALSNLISNAVKFVGPGVAPVVRVSVDLDPRLARIRVRDNGIGIDARYHDRIFKMFERLSAGDEFPGTGVGLAIVKKAVERMNGAIGLESEPGRGSCFWIQLARGDAE